MGPRIDLMTDDVATGAVRHLIAAERPLRDVVPASTLELVRIRASQINGCGFCVDMHTKDAAAAGETAQRLNLVAAWREATPVFTDAERAALALAEAGTRIADRGEVPDEVWEEAARHYDDHQLTALVCQIATINAFNVVNVMTRQPAGLYQPGMFAQLHRRAGEAGEREPAAVGQK